MSTDLRPAARPLAPADVVTVMAMASSLAEAVDDPPPQLTAEALLRAVAEGWCECFVAELRHEIAGYALVSRSYEAHTGKRRLWLGDLYVKPSARRCGVGGTLIARVARHALELQCDALYWELWRPNSAAARFFSEVGAEAVAELAITRLNSRALSRLASRV
jgi:GNAT superfamily N-acetyltransferase